MAVTIPESHRDLSAGPVNLVLTTLMPDGQPQSTHFQSVDLAVTFRYTVRKAS